MSGKESRQPSLLKRYTESQIDWSLVEPRFAWEIKNPSFPTEFWDNAFHLLKSRRLDWMFPNYREIVRSEPLEKFLQDNRPPTLFFDPAEIAQVLSPSSDVVVEYSKTKKYEEWKFRLNRQKYPPKEDEIEYAMTYRKPLVDFNSGRFKSFHPEPYIVVQFPAVYDGSQVIFSPEIEGTYGEPHPFPPGELEKQMLILLGVPEKKVEQKLGLRLAIRQRNWPDGTKSNIYSVRIHLKQA